MKIKNIWIFFAVIFLAVSIVPHSVLADGMMMQRDPYSDRWDYSDEKNQQAFINYENGSEKMILSVGADNQGSSMSVWIFPIPANPNKIILDTVTDLPRLYGDEISQRAQSDLDSAREFSQMTQVYSIPFLMMSHMLGGSSDFGSTTLSAGGGFEKMNAQDVNVYDHLEKDGIVSEIVTAKTGNGLSQYLSGKGLTIENKTIAVLNQYIGKDFSFVVSWISNGVVAVDTNSSGSMTPQLTEPRLSENGQGFVTPGSLPAGAPIAIKNGQKGVFVTFPTDKIYFPLLPTSVYGSKIVPATIRVIGHVTPEVFADIKNYTQVGYYIQSNAYFGGNGSNLNFFLKNQVKDLAYTKVEINAPSKLFTKDLWFKNSAPLKTYWPALISKSPLINFILLMLISSLAASFFSGWIIFKEWRNKQGLIKFGLIGLANCLSLAGFIIAVIFARTKRIKEEDGDVFAELKNRGYSNWAYQITDKRKFLLILIFSVSFLLISWLVVATAKFSIHLAFPEVKEVVRNSVRF